MKPDPKKAIYMEPGRRTLRRGQQLREGQGERGRCTRGTGGWEPHKGDAALDSWGTAIRDMRKAGTLPAGANR